MPSDFVFQPLHRLFCYQLSALLTLFSSFSSVHRRERHREGSVCIRYHVGEDKAICVFHIWWISHRRDSSFFLGRGHRSAKYPVPLGGSHMLESYRINSPLDLLPWSCPPPPLLPPGMMPMTLDDAYDLGCCLAQEASNPAFGFSSKKTNVLGERKARGEHNLAAHSWIQPKDIFDPYRIVFHDMNQWLNFQLLLANGEVRQHRAQVSAGDSWLELSSCCSTPPRHSPSICHPPQLTRPPMHISCLSPRKPSIQAVPNPVLFVINLTESVAATSRGCRDYEMAAHNTFDGEIIHLMFFGATHTLPSRNKNETNCVLGSYGSNEGIWIKQNHYILKSNHLEEVLIGKETVAAGRYSCITDAFVTARRSPKIYECSHDLRSSASVLKIASPIFVGISCSHFCVFSF